MSFILSLTEIVMKGFGLSLEEGVAGFVLVLMIFFVISLLTMTTVGISLFAASYFFYKGKYERAFLTSGLIGSALFSVGGSALISSLVVNDFGQMRWMAPTLFILGISFIIFKYRKIAGHFFDHHYHTLRHI